MAIYEQCYDTHSGDLSQVLQCVSEWAEGQQSATETTSTNFQYAQFALAEDFRQWLLIICGALVFFMQTGFAMVCAGSVRKKNMNNT